MAVRDPFAARAVTSRRGGPTKQALSRDLIVDTALELLAHDGLEGMSLRRVATALSTGPASLYAYVDDLQALRTLVCDRALADVNTTVKPRSDWRARLLAILGSYHHVLAGRPGLAQLAMTTMAAGPNSLRILEALLALLAEAGVDRTTAAWATDLLLLYVTAIAAEHSQRQIQPDWLGPVARVLGAVTPAAHPNIHASREALLSGGPARSTWALEALLTGILHTPVAAKPKPRR